MTDEEIIGTRLKVLEKDLASINNRLHHAFNQGFELGRKSTIPKTGWRIVQVCYENRFYCSCGFIEKMDNSMIKWQYCPVCGGTRMVEPQRKVRDKEWQ